MTCENNNNTKDVAEDAVVTEQQQQLQLQRSVSVQEAIAKETESNGSLGETNVPDASMIRSILAPPSPLEQ